MSICIFPGKFQPFHNGQLLVAKGMFKTCGHVVIAICHGGEEMFSVEEVREMISGALLDEDIVDAHIVDVPDIEGDEEWVDSVLEAAEHPEEALVWSGKEEIRALFESKGIKTQKIAEVPGIVGEEIREMIKNKDTQWSTKVPAAVMKVIEKHIE